MKNNKSKEIYVYEGGNDGEENFVTSFNKMDARKMSCYCGICNHHLGDIVFEINSFVRVSSNNIKKKVLDKIIPPSPTIGMDIFVTYCNNCKRDTSHYIVDRGLGNVIRMLNVLGLTTNFSCESHSFDSDCYISMPYILFNEDVSRYFHMDNPLLEYWNWESDFNILRVSEDAPVRYITEDICIKNLETYIKNFIQGDKNNE